MRRTVIPKSKREIRMLKKTSQSFEILCSQQQPQISSDNILQSTQQQSHCTNDNILQSTQAIRGDIERGDEEDNSYEVFRKA